jgi:DNA-binding MarR family transcriptional regulator
VGDLKLHAGDGNPSRVRVQVKIQESLPPYVVAVPPEETSRADEAVWLSPDEMQTWRALHAVSTALPDVLGSQLRSEVNLSFLEYYVLGCLSEAPDHALRMSVLAALAGSELSRLSHLMHRLETRGLVRRVPDPADGRFTLALLTPAGDELAVKAAPIHVDHVRRLIFDVLDEAEQHALREALTKILSKLMEGL